MFLGNSILFYLLADLSCNIKNFGRREQRKRNVTFLIIASILWTAPHKQEEFHSD